MSINKAFCDAVSFDIESLDTIAGGVVLALGMVHFNVFTGEIGDTFYISFDRDEWLERGYTQSASTLKWWADPAQDKARPFLGINRRKMVEGLNEAVYWLCGRNMSNGLWSRGYMDETMLRVPILKALQIEDPWNHRAPSDARTLALTLERCDIDPCEPWHEIEFVGTPHYALDDALHESKIVSSLHQALLRASPVTLKPASNSSSEDGVKHAFRRGWDRAMHNSATIHPSAFPDVFKEELAAYFVDPQGD